MVWFAQTGPPAKAAGRCMLAIMHPITSHGGVTLCTDLLPHCVTDLLPGRVDASVTDCWRAFLVITARGSMYTKVYTVYTKECCPETELGLRTDHPKAITTCVILKTNPTNLFLAAILDEPYAIARHYGTQQELGVLSLSAAFTTSLCERQPLHLSIVTGNITHRCVLHLTSYRACLH